MPHLLLTLNPAPGVTPDLHALALTLTALTEEHLDKDPALTAVRIEPWPETGWFIGGRSMATDSRASYHLEVLVTAGTNDEAQIAAYLAAVHATLARTLGPLHPVSYGVVRQQPATAWGYGGLTQAQRRRTGRDAGGQPEPAGVQIGSSVK